MSKVRLAILGCGGWSGVHAKRLKERKDVELVALSDVTDTIMTYYIERNLADCETRPDCFTDIPRMLEQARPDAVMICTPHTLHFDHAMMALEHGCHVFLEKPMVTHADHAYKLAAKVKETGKILVVGYNTPCTPEFFYIREQIRAGGLGRLELISGYLSQDWLRHTAGKWRQDPALSGGGQAYDSGAHLLNSLCWSVESDIAEVFAYVDNHGSPVDINSSINVRFTSGVMASIAIGGNSPSNGSFMAFMFDNGRIEVDGWSGNWIRVWKGKEPVKYPHIEGQSQHPDDNFIDAVLGKAEPRTSAANGIVQSELMDAIYESARTGKPARPRRKH